MGKKRVEKKEEERRIIAEFEEALSENRTEEDAPACEEKPKEKQGCGEKEDMPEKLHCKRCKTLMENGVCPQCGFRIYMPMKKEKRDKIRLIVAVVCIVAFVILYVGKQIANG